MARKRKENNPISLKQPDRSGPTQETLLQFAEERDLFEQAKKKEAANKKRQNPEASKEEEYDTTISLGAERVLEAVLWSVSLAILHFTFDVLVQHQYAMVISWNSIVIRAFQAFLVFLILFYVLHPHAASPTFVPTVLVPARFQPILRQVIFFGMSVVCGCYLIHITNKYSYLAVLKQSPSLGCLWIWSVIELDLVWAVPSLAVAALFVWQGDYKLRQ